MARSITLAIVAPDLLVRNVTLVSATGRRVVDIAMRGEVIEQTADPGGIGDAGEAEEIDGTGLHAFPGLIDGHVHFREPGLEHEEDWRSGTSAAVMGGVTTVLEMPNTKPPTDTVERAQAKIALAQAAAMCDFGLFGLLGPDVGRAVDVARSGLVVGLKAFLGPTTGGLSAPTEDGLREVLRVAAELGLRVAFHAEDGATVERRQWVLRTAGRNDVLAHLESRPPEAEVAAIDQVGALLLETAAAGHVLHVSSAQGLAAIERWRVAGAAISCEATPHHALLEREAYALGGLVRVNPPFRGEPHLIAVLDALTDGRIDCLASDHAPHLAAQKQNDSIWDVPAGFAGVETLLPLMLSYGVRAGRLSLERLVYLTSEGPARTWGLWPRKASLEPGADADLTLVDLDRPGTVRAADLHGKNNLSPFEGWPTRGAAVMTIVRGRVVMRDGQLTGEPGWGRLVSPG